MVFSSNTALKQKIIFRFFKYFRSYFYNSLKFFKCMKYNTFTQYLRKYMQHLGINNNLSKIFIINTLKEYFKVQPNETKKGLRGIK